jgi:hypothetical protein
LLLAVAVVEVTEAVVEQEVIEQHVLFQFQDQHHIQLQLDLEEQEVLQKDLQVHQLVLQEQIQFFQQSLQVVVVVVEVEFHQELVVQV